MGAGKSRDRRGGELKNHRGIRPRRARDQRGIKAGRNRDRTGKRPSPQRGGAANAPPVPSVPAPPRPGGCGRSASSSSCKSRSVATRRPRGVPQKMGAAPKKREPPQNSVWGLPRAPPGEQRGQGPPKPGLFTCSGISPKNRDPPQNRDPALPENSPKPRGKIRENSGKCGKKKKSGKFGEIQGKLRKIQENPRKSQISLTTPKARAEISFYSPQNPGFFWKFRQNSSRDGGKWGMGGSQSRNSVGKGGFSGQGPLADEEALEGAVHVVPLPRNPQVSTVLVAAAVVGLPLPPEPGENLGFGKNSGFGGLWGRNSAKNPKFGGAIQQKSQFLRRF